ncbi:hypothetical protein PHYPSEUDO_003520 [Phytophthora pseudosyringae]|uniref:Myb-like domain-containing protein n=1 Tax=Phytophthora pseudosyringae TaxID=221518 RepID=A0A8T1VVN3_9STRA|nr:hypothetical protein PHYPSEUDO_003520 [Phytophthora pseudosyringae]
MSSSSLGRAASAPLPARGRSRYSSVLESALVGLGREDAVVKSARKQRRKRRQGVDGQRSPVRRLQHALSAPERRPAAAEEEEEEDPFAVLKLLKSHKKKKKEREEGTEEMGAVTRSAAKRQKRRKRRHAGVLEMAGRTPVTRSMVKEGKKRERSSLEAVEVDGGPEEDVVVVQKKLLFQSPEKKKKKKERIRDGGSEEKKTENARVNRKAAVLQQWRVEWPPVRQADSERAEMVLTGLVHGKAARFVVGKRQGATKFTSKDGEYVSLSGKLDRDAATRAGIPSAAVDLMEDGVPAFFFKRLLPFVQKPQRTKSAAKRTPPMKKASRADKYSSPMPAIDEEVELMTEAAIVSTPVQDDDVFETPKPRKSRAPVNDNKKSAKTEQPEPEAEVDVWTNEELEALLDAKLKIPTTASNFWAQVAQYVPGKSAQECQAKTFEQFRSPPTNRKAAKRSIKRANAEANAAISAKIARAGSNKFKKQVREFVEEYEKKHVDDLFETTPSKEGLPELPEFDSIKSPELATPSRSFDDDDSEMDDEAPGLLKKLSSRRRDDIDSYVLGLNRQHVAGGGVMVGGKVRRVTSMVTPVKAAKAKATSTKKKAVVIVQDVGSRSLRGVVSPGGTTHVRIEKDGSSSEGEGEDDYHSSEEEEEDFDIP